MSVLQMIALPLLGLGLLVFAVVAVLNSKVD